MHMVELRGHHEWLDNELVELGFLGNHLWSMGCVPGNGGDISVLLPFEVQEALTLATDNSAREIKFDNIPELSQMRSHRRPYYRAQAISDEVLSGVALDRIHGRAILATVSGAKIWDLARKPNQQLCVISVNVESKSFKILYGNSEFGNVPTTEIVNHLVAHAANLNASFINSAVLHVHLQNTIDLSRHPRAAGFKSFNQAIYSQRPELLANVPDLVGLLPYLAPGSASLVEETIAAIPRHRVITWKGHGVLIREASVERCVDLAEYLETSAASALRDLALGNVLWRLSPRDLQNFVESYGLQRDVLKVFNS